MGGWGLGVCVHHPMSLTLGRTAVYAAALHTAGRSYVQESEVTRVEGCSSGLCISVSKTCCLGHVVVNARREIIIADRMVSAYEGSAQYAPPQQQQQQQHLAAAPTIVAQRSRREASQIATTTTTTTKVLVKLAAS